ncbi:MAG: GNAT family N-acetyltransferase [Erysipelotrichaceae bacterium]|nr:GNAT family N-acetyltransferase [Erysipelotrichaceae bacterium]
MSDLTLIRKANEEDLSRIAEILVFVKRINYRRIFLNDDFSFNELQVLKVAKEYQEKGRLKYIYVYDDGIVKGMIHIYKNEIVELYVDHFFEDQGIGTAMIRFAIEKFKVTYLWALEKNSDAIRFYERNGFYLSGERKLEEGTVEYLVMMKRETYGKDE